MMNTTDANTSSQTGMPRPASSEKQESKAIAVRQTLSQRFESTQSKPRVSRSAPRPKNTKMPTHQGGSPKRPHDKTQGRWQRKPVNTTPAASRPPAEKEEEDEKTPPCSSNALLVDGKYVEPRSLVFDVKESEPVAQPASVEPKENSEQSEPIKPAQPPPADNGDVPPTVPDDPIDPNDDLVEPEPLARERGRHVSECRCWKPEYLRGALPLSFYIFAALWCFILWVLCYELHLLVASVAHLHRWMNLIPLLVWGFIAILTSWLWSKWWWRKSPSCFWLKHVGSARQRALTEPDGLQRFLCETLGDLGQQRAAVAAAEIFRSICAWIAPKTLTASDLMSVFPGISFDLHSQFVMCNSCVVRLAKATLSGHAAFRLFLKLCQYRSVTSLTKINMQNLCYELANELSEMKDSRGRLYSQSIRDAYHSQIRDLVFRRMQAVILEDFVITNMARMQVRALETLK